MKISKRIFALVLVAIMAFSACITASAAEKATTLKLNAATIKWAVGKSGHFKPTVTPEGASKTFNWTSSNPTVATVSSAGKLTAKSVGKTTITCATTDGSNLKATCAVTVGKAVTSLKLNAKTIKWPVGKAGHFKPTVLPEDAIIKSLKWTSSNPAVATVSSAGKLTAVSAGTTTITCATTDGSNLKATCAVTVTGGTSNLATSLKLNATRINWPAGKAGHFKPTVLPDSASKTLSWTSSNPAVATVSSAGKLTAVSAGTTTITCATTDGSNLKATCAVTVTGGTSNLATSLKLNATRINWPAGKAGHFKPTVLPDTASKTLSWTSSNPAVATVSSAGKLTAVSAGTTTITCATTDGSNLKATCAVTVTGGTSNLATSLKLNATRINWPVGKAGSFKPTVLPDTASKTLSWTSSNPAVATVSSAGKLTAVSAGTTTITCATTDGSNLKATCTVSVYEIAEPVVIPVESVTLNTASITWIPGKSGNYTATVSPSNATNKALEWTSSDTSVATVSQTGKLTAVSVGTATITCKATDGSGKYATCTVKVVEPVSSISFEVSSIQVFKGKTATLYPIVEPHNAYNKNLTWTSSDASVATVSSSGVVTAKASGTAIITCTAKDGSGKSATCSVKVGSKLTNLALTAKSITWEKGKSGSFKTVLTPSDAITTLSWESLNPAVATVDGNGKLTAVSAGTATIVCKTADGTNKTVYCYVLVTDSSNPSTNYNEYFKNYFRDGVYTISGETSADVEGETYDSKIKYGVNNIVTSLRMDLNIMLMNVTMLTKADGVYMLIPPIIGITEGVCMKIEDADTTKMRLFDNLIYKGSTTEKINGVNYNVESFTPYGLESLTVQFYFNSTGTLKYIKQVKADGKVTFISNVKVSGTYTASDYEIPDDYEQA